MTITSYIPEWLPGPALETAGTIHMALHLLRRADNTSWGNVNPSAVRWDRCVFENINLEAVGFVQERVTTGRMTLKSATLWKWLVNPDGFAALVAHAAAKNDAP